MAYCKSCVSRGKWMAVVLLLISCAASAAGTESKNKVPQIPAGLYATERSWGNIEVTRAGDRQSFKLITAGNEAQACLMKGDIIGRTAKLPTGDGKRMCELRFTRVGTGFKLEEISKNNQCREFCGPDAQFAGQYYRITAACQAEHIQKEQERAKVLLENKAFVSARDRLRPILRDCGKTLDPWSEARVRNDLASVQQRLGDVKACRETLAPLVEHAEKSDANIRRAYPQAEAEMIIDILALTRILLDQCPAKN